MSELTRAYQLRIWDSAGSAVETTFTDDDFAQGELPTIGWSRVSPLDGQVTSIPTVVRLVDTSEQVTAILADADGRADLIGRIVDLRIDEGGAGYDYAFRGRISAIRLSDSVAGYDMHLADERWTERNADVFTGASTTQVIPSGLRSAWHGFDAAPTMLMVVVSVIDADTVLLVPLNPPMITQQVVEWLAQDVNVLSTLSGEPPFRYTRIHVGGTDREIVTFAQNPLTGALGQLEEIADDGEPRELRTVRVRWPTHGQTAGTIFSGCYIYAPDAPLSETMPEHVGGDTGQDFFSWLKDRYDEIGTRYETAAFTAYNASTNPNGLIGHPRIPKVFIRATETKRLSAVVHRFCRTFGIVPFVNKDGEVAPRFVFLPQSIDPTTLTEIDGTSARPPHPTWSQESAEIRTVVVPTWTYRRHVDDDVLTMDADAPIDRIVEKEMILPELTHDRVSQLGRHIQEVDVGFVQDPVEALGLVSQYARELFDRYGDGAIRGVIRGLSATSDVDVGDYVKVTLSSFPNPAAQARGGTRIVQIMGRQQQAGYSFDYLDAGPNEQPLQAPGVAIAQNTTDTHHAVDVTISGLTTGATYQLQLKVGSGDWRTRSEGSANETVTIGQLPSGTQIQARALETMPGRIRSDYSVAASVTTASLTAPSGLTISDEGADRGTATWTPGETGYDLEILVDATSIGIFHPTSTTYIITGLSPSTSYTVAVRHVDPYGGTSASASATLATTAGTTSLISPTYVGILEGGSGLVGSAAQKVFAINEPKRIRTGVAVYIALGNDEASTEIQRADGDGYGNPDSATAETVAVLPPGKRIFLDELPLDGEERFYKARHLIGEHAESSWQGWDRGTPRRLPLRIQAIPEKYGTNKILNAQLEAVPQSNGKVKYLLTADLDDGVESLEISYNLWKTPAGGSATNLSLSIAVDDVEGTTYSEYLRETFPNAWETISEGTGALIKGALAAGQRTITVDDATSLTGTVKAGDRVVIDGHATYYQITLDATAAGDEITLQITPEIQSAIADDTGVTIQNRGDLEVEPDSTLTTWGGCILYSFNLDGGLGEYGQMGALVRPTTEPADTSGAGTTVTDGSSTIKADAAKTGNGLTLTDDSGQPKIDVDPEYQVVVSSSDPTGSWGAGDKGRIWVDTS